jgi:tetraacyldisaccharide 4'-kinase
MKRPFLAPLVPLYAAGVAFHELRLRRGWGSMRRLQRPVISVGNLSTGGAGKTPFTIALAKLLVASGYSVDVLSRGYGRQSKEPARVNPAGSVSQFGDEPLVIARETHVPVYVAAQRYDAGLLAEADTNSQGRQGGRASLSVLTHLLDDGFQHRLLHRDIDILLLHRADFRDSLLPAGDLREPLRALKRASVIAIPADDPSFEADVRASGWAGPVWRLRRRMEVPVFTGPALAFCGIARPDQFFAGLKTAGVRIVKSVTFPDHHRYTANDVQRLDNGARQSNALVMLTTEKDKVRLASFTTWRPLLTVGLHTEIEDEEAALHWLTERITAASAG